jgi:hypothetical protein
MLSVNFITDVIKRSKNSWFVHRYSETNVMHFLFSLLRIKGLYMFRALLAHFQEVLHKHQLVYCVHVTSVGCTRIRVVYCMLLVERLLRMSK